MASTDGLFSKEALDKLRSPERLDTMLPITRPVHWMIILAVLVVLAGVVLWSIFGAFTVKVTGMGMITDAAGVSTVSHTDGGKVIKVRVTPGTYVHRGDIIAEVEQPAKSADTQLAQYGIDTANNNEQVIERTFAYDEKSYQEDISRMVTSNYEGTVEEIMVEPGSVITAGMPICTVRGNETEDAVNGLFYIPVAQAKRVEPGMHIQIVPNSVDEAESGSLIGIVRSVSNYPVTGETVQKNLANRDLAQYIMQSNKSAVMEVSFFLLPDNESGSKYLWTTAVGDHKPVEPGTFCTGTIIVDRRPPLQRVFYKLSQWLRSR